MSLGAARFSVKPTEPDEFIKIIQGVVRDLDEGKIKPGTLLIETEVQALKLYDEHLINKLEQKMLELEKEVAERKRAEEELERYREHLEEMVKDRTAELQALVDAMSGREVRMADLKDVIKLLRKQIEEAGMEPVADDPLLG